MKLRAGTRSRPQSCRIRSMCGAMSAAWNPGDLTGLSFTVLATPGVADGLFWQDAAKTTPADAATEPVRVSVCAYTASEPTAPSDAARPLVYAESVGYSLSFDGSNDCLRLTRTIADTSGSLVVAFTTGTSFAARRVLFSASDPTAAGTYWEVGVGTDGRLYWECSAAGVVQWTIAGSSFLDTSTAYTLYLTHDDTDFYAALDSPTLTGVEQNPLTVTSGTGPGVWLGDAAGMTEITVGGTVTSGGLQRAWNGRIASLILCAEDIS